MKLVPVSGDPFASRPSTGPRLTPVQGDPFAEPPSRIDRALASVQPALDTLGDIGQVYPALEAGANLATQAIAMPVAGLSGIGAAIANLIGANEPAGRGAMGVAAAPKPIDPAQTVADVADALTYKPQTERGQRLTGNTLYPFEKIAEAGNVVGENVAELPVVPSSSGGRGAAALEGSPALGAIANALTQIAAPPALGKGAGIVGRKIAERRSPIVEALPETAQTAEAPPAQFREAPSPVTRSRPVEEIEAAPPPVETPRPLADTPLIRGAPDEQRPDRSGLRLRANEDVLRTIGGGDPAQGWASATRVRRGGRPATVYRGEAVDLSPEHFAPESLGYATQHPSASLGVWFTNSKADAGRYGPKVAEHHLDVRNPKVFKVEDFPAFDSPETARAFRQQLEAAGHDGILVTAKHLGGPQHVVAFKPEQVVRARAPRIPKDDKVESQINSFSPGASYVGFIDSSTPPKPPGQGAAQPANSLPAFPFGKKQAEPIRREDILRPFLKALNAPLYEGRVKGAGVQGWFRPFKETVRVKRKSDLETTAHEIAHLIDDRVFNGFRSVKTKPKARPWEQGPNAQTYAKELRSISYDHSKTYEGFAEFVRLYMTQPDKARATAPEFSKWFDDFVQKHEYGPALSVAADGMQSWFNQGDLAKAASKIGEQKPLNDVMDTWRDEIRQSVFDDLHGILKMEADLTGSTDNLGAYQIARLSRAAYSIVDGALSMGAPKVRADGSHTFVGKGLEQILEPVARDLDNWTLYAVGRSAKELFTQGREKLFTRNEIAEMVSLETPEFRKAFDEYQAWNKAVVDFAQAKGLINPETRALWKRSEYLPFYRSGQGAPTKRANGIEGNWNGIKRLTGGTGNIRSVLGNMIQNASMLMSEALKNEARVQVADLAENVQGGGRFMAKLHKDNRAITIDREQIRAFVADMLGVKPGELKSGGGMVSYPPEWQAVIDQLTTEFEAKPDFIQFWMRGQAPRGDNVVAVMRGGKPTFYEVADPMLLRSLQALNRPGKHMVVRFLSWFRRVGQSSITLSPDFIAANIVRDTLMAGIMSRNGFRPIMDSLSGFKSRLTKDEAYKEFIANGGGLASHLLDEQAFKGHLERFYTKRGINFNTVLNTPSKLLYALETLADATELSTRMGEYKRARGEGMPPRQAAYQAREISTDFAMRGDSPPVAVMYDTVLFLKAAMNSMDRLYRGLAKDPQKAKIAAKTGLLALASMWLYSQNRDNPKYQDLEDWDKDTHWHFFVGDHHFRMPKIWEIGAVSSLAERSMAAMMDDDKYGKGLGEHVGRILANLFHVEMIPQAFKPLYEQAINRNTFTDRPIETMGMESMQKWARAAPQTNRALTELGVASRDLPESLQINPVRTEALLRGYFNTWAMYGLTLSDAALFDDKPEMRIDEYPVIRRFYSADPAKHTRYETEFYEMLREATELRRTMTQMDKVGRPEIASELQTKPRQDEYTFLNKMNTQLRGIYKAQREVHLDRTMSPEEKRARLDELTQERNDLLKDVVQGVNERDSLRSADQ